MRATNGIARPAVALTINRVSLTLQYGSWRDPFHERTGGNQTWFIHCWSRDRRRGWFKMRNIAADSLTATDGVAWSSVAFTQTLGLFGLARETHPNLPCHYHFLADPTILWRRINSVTSTTSRLNRYFR